MLSASLVARSWSLLPEKAPVLSSSSSQRCRPLLERAAHAASPLRGEKLPRPSQPASLLYWDHGHLSRPQRIGRLSSHSLTGAHNVVMNVEVAARSDSGTTCRTPVLERSPSLSARSQLILAAEVCVPVDQAVPFAEVCI